MCGILGAFSPTEEQKKQFAAVLSTLKHRGPDHEGIVVGKDSLLGHQRLSIVDVEGGNQPFECPETKRSLICNGEIYNYSVLRDTFPEYPFKTRSDSEVILPLYAARGETAAADLDGMFSLLVSEGSSFYAARDPIGIKPLYYGTDGASLFFASEMKALVSLSERIYEFPNGHYYRSGQGLVPYYQLPDPDSFITDRAEAVRLISSGLRESVRKRLMSDVPVGVFLSGGLDSSLIAALMAEHIEGLHSFSVGFEGAPDLKAARKVAEHLGTIHHEYVYTSQDVLKALPRVIYHLESFDPALIRSAIPCYFVSQLAGSKVKVVLSGEGSDELFAGYSYLTDFSDPGDLQIESRRILNGLHNLNLQRVDRMTMAHGLEGRVPFLDTDFIETVLHIHPSLKLPGAFGIEKGILRDSFRGLLPDEIMYRDKMEFAQGCGSSTFLEDRAASIPDTELSEARNKGFPVSTKEELMYYRLFRDYYDHPDAMTLVGRWKGTLH
jgi:asparagine synthase (glutamine-hydrolysing)